MAGDPLRLHPDDKAELLEALLKGRAQEVVPDRPPAYATGRDAEVMSRAAEIQVQRAVEKFLTKEQIESLFEKALTERLKRIGLNTDEDHIDETGDVVRGALRWQKRLDKVFGGIILTGLTALVIALLKLIGINAPSLGLGGH